MKSLFISALIIALSNLVTAQSFTPLDESPMDAAYFPDNFAHDRESDQKAIIKVYYSRPHKKGRETFGGIVSYNKIWRTGANEAIEFKAYQDISIGEKDLKAGTYSLFTIPGKTEWTIIINSDLDYWGAYSYDKKNDILRITVPVGTLTKELEAFSIRFEDTQNNSAVMRIGWDKTLVEVPIKY